MDVEINWPPSGQNINSLTLGLFQVALSYELNNSRKSGTLPITLPINMLNLLSPSTVSNEIEFKSVWDQISSGQSQM